MIASSRARRGAAAVALLVAGAAQAQAHAQAQAQTAAPAPPPAAAASAASAPHQNLTRTVIEDDRVRIEETRLRGQPQRITVRSKVPGAKEYEIIVPPGGQDASQERGAAGKRAWNLLSF